MSCFNAPLLRNLLVNPTFAELWVLRKTARQNTITRRTPSPDIFKLMDGLQTVCVGGWVILMEKQTSVVLILATCCFNVFQLRKETTKKLITCQIITARCLLFCREQMNAQFQARAQLSKRNKRSFFNLPKKVFFLVKSCQTILLCLLHFDLLS